MVTQIDLGTITVEVVRKKIKNIHLSVHPPSGKVRIAAPLRLDLDTIRVFVITRLEWIKRQQQKLRAQEREPAREYIERESHYVWGRRYLLQVIEKDAPPRVELQHNKLVLQVRPGADRAKKQSILEDWYRTQLKQAVPPLIAKWEPLMGVTVERFFVQRMKTQWGSCNPVTASIRLNTDLAKKPPEFLECVVVHEMVHLIEPTHSSRFRALMDQFMPKWTFYRSELNRLPVRSEEWNNA
ncbi:M48 family metallopeptidase [Gloeobacter morelensis]|uniref:M48 family metallopeptidase n=1 Tax=Gloeobacter morelensis MG652769 TaxID=2781736 RepID=A0ABY3PNH4_9CYAN|nr:SprT family zinc-dependent metalloprotease [Gloeobacter morelensis]UFP95118.1 M48 family metallopeptidase [Gloeobacter morelensis MG652769]